MIEKTSCRTRTLLLLISHLFIPLPRQVYLAILSTNSFIIITQNELTSRVIQLMMNKLFIIIILH